MATLRLYRRLNLREPLRPFQAHTTGTPKVLEDAPMFLVSPLTHNNRDNWFSLHNPRRSTADGKVVTTAIYPVRQSFFELLCSNPKVRGKAPVWAVQHGHVTICLGEALASSDQYLAAELL